MAIFTGCFANITPDYGLDGSLQGYFSVRRQAARSAIDLVQPVYAEMCRIEAQHGKSEAPDVSMNWLLEQMRQQGTDYESFVLKINASAMNSASGSFGMSIQRNRSPFLQSSLGYWLLGFNLLVLPTCSTCFSCQTAGAG